MQIEACAALHSTTSTLILVCQLIRLLEDVELLLRAQQTPKNGKMTALICLLENKCSIEDELRW